MRCSLIIASIFALIFLISAAYGSGEVLASFGGVNKGCTVSSSEVLDTIVSGSYSSTSTLSMDSGTALEQSVQSNGLSSFTDTLSMSSSNGKNKAELYWNIINGNGISISGTVINQPSCPSDLISLEQTYTGGSADEALFKAKANSGTKYNAEASTDIIKGGFNSFNHLAKATNNEALVTQTIDDAWGETITRALTAKSPSMGSTRTMTTITDPASSTNTKDYSDSAKATKSGVTILPPLPSLPKLPCVPGWPSGPGWHF